MDNAITKKNKAGQCRLFSIITSYFAFIGLVLVLVIFQIATEGRLLASRNLMNIFNNFFSIGLGAMSITFLMSLGELDLSVGAIMGFAAAQAALAGAQNLALIFPVALLTGLAIGFLNGFLIARLKVASFIGTLAVSFIARGITTFMLNGTVGIPSTMRVYDNNTLKITVFVGAMVLFFILFNFGAFGKQCRSVGASAEAARQSGVKVAWVRILAFTISGLVCGLLGYFSLMRTLTASSSTGSAFEFDLLLAVLFGGMPLSGGWPVKFRSAVIGSVAMAAMKSGMSLIGWSGLTQQLVQGVLLIAIACVCFDRRSAVVTK